LNSPSDERRREAPEKRFEGNILELNLDESIQQLKDEPPVHDEEQSHRQVELFRHEGRTVSLMELDAGATIPEHSVEDGPVMIQVLDGTLCFQSEDEDHHGHYESNDLLFLKPGTLHSVQAETDSRFLLTIMR